MTEKFEIHSRLGAGGMADVSLARAVDTGRWVALKRIRGEIAIDPDAVAQFEREARICALLHHENIVALESFGRDAHGPYLALEYVAGTSASALLKALRVVGQAIPLPVVLSLIRDASLGLAYAHAWAEPAGGIIHRDVSLENILIARSGLAKLSDFGIAKLHGGTTLTKTGTLKGKIGYMAPELLNGADANVASDLFALGATLFQLACGVPPFPGRNEGEVVRALLMAAPLAPGSLRPDLPREIADWTARALAKNPAERAPLVQLQRALQAALAGAVPAPHEQVAACLAQTDLTLGAVPDLAPGTRLARASARRRWPWAFAAIAGLALASGGAVWWSRQSPPVVVEVPPAPVVATPAPPPPPPEPAPAPPPERPVAGPALGTVWIRVSPWARVFFDGQLKGVTPLQPFAAKPGMHSLILVNEELKVRKSYSVRVVAHQQANLKYTLDK